MTLVVMSAADTAEMSSPGRKRTHEEYSHDISDVQREVKGEHQFPVKVERADSGLSAPEHLSSSLTPSMQSSPAALNEMTSTSTTGANSTLPYTPTRQPLQPVTPVPQNGANTTQHAVFPPAKTSLPTGQGPPAKRKRLTPAEKQAKQDEEAAKKAEKEKKRQEQEALKQANEEKRAQKQAEKDKKQAEVEAKKKEREQREREKKEEAERKARAQTKIGAFFKRPATAPKTITSASPAATQALVEARSPSPAAAQSEYEKLAIPFFVHNNVSLAKDRFAMDQDAREAKTTILTDYLTGKRSPAPTKPFDPLTALHLHTTPLPRGKRHPQVREIMAHHEGGLSSPINLITESMSLPTQKSLKAIPMKQFSFHEDVRPGYYGTITSVGSLATLQRMARHPAAKNLPLNYDYDSEAEWVQGDEEEDAEGIDDMTDDEEEEEDDKSMDGFLDDSEDTKRGLGGLMPANSMEPESSGICFEDGDNRNPNAELRKFGMEVLIPNLEQHHSIDPFSKAYWAPETKAEPPSGIAQLIKAQATKSHNADSTSNGCMLPPPAPKASTATAGHSAVDLIPANMIDEFKSVILEFKFLPKTALIPTLQHKFDKCKKAQIAATLDHVAEKPKKKGDWHIKAGL
ncbi:chromatin assembly factor 1 subunit A-domain-containing protein [Coniella lustricola]|uniref:Chromatin assembly factor 1 subunit A-domain-containing protein n=1 Tax=Coniella lustricola TaxID=2025994 RepID=A0A2T3AC28_9PEZI|nr:chromatin assembly factor 1 subunit A-domain-containing protein [Coniella lustricola]